MGLAKAGMEKGQILGRWKSAADFVSNLYPTSIPEPLGWCRAFRISAPKGFVKAYKIQLLAVRHDGLPSLR
jgi:hypothetical protein